MSNNFNFFESMSFNQVIDEVFHSQESQKNSMQKDNNVNEIVEEKPKPKKRTFQGKNRGVSSTKLAKYVKELIQCLRPTDVDQISLSVTQLKQFILPYFPACYKQSLDRRIYDVVGIMKKLQIISGQRREIRIARKPHPNDFDRVTYEGGLYNERIVAKKVKMMSIDDPNISQILNPMNWFITTRAEPTPIKSAKQRFDQYMATQDLSYLSQKPLKKA